MTYDQGAMGRLLGAGILLLSAATNAAALQGDREYDFWSFLKKGTVITPCSENSDAAKAAARAIETLNGSIEAATVSTPLPPLVRDFHELLKTACFQMAVENGDPPKFSHVLSFKDWWVDSGRSWLAGYLREHRYGLSTDLKRVTVFPGEPRSVLLPFRVADPFLKTLMCPPEQECPGVNGWRERAESGLTPRTPPQSWFENPTTDLWRACEKHAATVNADETYKAYRVCLLGGLDFEAYRKLGVDPWRTHQKGSSLPIGNFRAPTDGWLSVSGRRGHYDFCDGEALFDLKTGSAFKSDSCSGLVLRQGGSVDFGATDARRQAKTVRGMVSLDNLRELVWMLLMKPHIDERNPSRSVPIPDSFLRRWTVVGDENGVSGGAVSGSTAQTFLSWKWFAPTGETRAQGELTWPPWFWSPNRADSHAAELLSVMEGSLERGCPVSRPSTDVEAAAAKGSSREERIERLLESAPSDEARESMRAALKKLDETQDRREPIDTLVDTESPRRRLFALVKEPCTSATVK